MAGLDGDEEPWPTAHMSPVDDQDADDLDDLEFWRALPGLAEDLAEAKNEPSISLGDYLVTRRPQT